MANTLTNLYTEIHMGLDTISRELVGFIPNVMRDSSAERAAKDQTIRFPIVPSYSTANITAAATGPDPSDSTISNSTLTISKSKSVTFYWEGEEERGLSNSGTFNTILADQFAQAMRALVNEVETDIGDAIYQGASRATGTAGTTPFGSNLDAAADVKKILDDNGAPTTGRALVLDTAAAANMAKLTQLTNVNQAGTNNLLNMGLLPSIFGMNIGVSGQIATHTKGTGTSYLINNASGEAIGQTTLTLDGGSGTMLAGDVITYAADTTNKYVVNTALAAGDVVIGTPGLLVAAPDDNAVTIGNSYTPNVAFSKDAFALVTRAPAMPTGGDAADDVQEFQDPVSGLAFQVALYRQRRRIAYEVGLAWGYKAVKADHIAILMG